MRQTPLQQAQQIRAQQIQAQQIRAQQIRAQQIRAQQIRAQQIQAGGAQAHQGGRRRLGRRLALGAVLSTAAAGWLLSGSLLASSPGPAGGAAAGRASGVPLASPGAPAAPRPAALAVYVVRPGDTLWSIAEAADPTADPRPLVDRLDAELGSTVVYPGEAVPLP